EGGDHADDERQDDDEAELDPGEDVEEREGEDAEGQRGVEDEEPQHVRGADTVTDTVMGAARRSPIVVRGHPVLSFPGRDAISASHVQTDRRPRDHTTPACYPRAAMAREAAATPTADPGQALDRVLDGSALT